MHKKQLELKGIYVVLAALFLVFLFMPVAILLYKSFESGTSLTLQHYRDLIFSEIGRASCRERVCQYV